MAEPICPRCGEHAFELVEGAPLNSQLRVMFMQCAACGAVVGVMDSMNLGSLLLEQGRVLQRIARTLGIDIERETDAA